MDDAATIPPTRGKIPDAMHPRPETAQPSAERVLRGGLCGRSETRSPAGVGDHRHGTGRGGGAGLSRRTSGLHRGVGKLRRGRWGRRWGRRWRNGGRSHAHRSRDYAVTGARSLTGVSAPTPGDVEFPAARATVDLTMTTLLVALAPDLDDALRPLETLERHLPLALVDRAHASTRKGSNSVSTFGLANSPPAIGLDSTG